MCVILKIDPGVTVPSGKLERACDINPDGFGIAYSTGSEIKIIRSIEKNDPKVVADHLQSLKKYLRFVHLRFSTVGTVSLDNSHPFVVLKDGRRRAQMVMMHNGTLSQFSPGSASEEKHLSDTHIFNRDFVVPIAERCAAYTSAKGVLDDKIFRAILSEKIGQLSVVVLFDRWNNYLRYNSTKGETFDGWWASNTYSFDNQHIRSSAKTTYSHNTHWRQQRWQKQSHGPLPWEPETPQPSISYQMADWEKELDRSTNDNEKGTSVVPFVRPRPGTDRASIPYNPVGYQKLSDTLSGWRSILQPLQEKVMDTKDGKPTIRNLKIKRLSFLEQTGLKDFDVLGNLSSADLDALCTKHPLGASQLIIDLFGQRQQLRLSVSQMTASIQKLIKEKEELQGKTDGK